jgi:threonine synthase
LNLRYVSTRGGVPPSDFETVLFAGLAPDGGLFVPANWPGLGADDLSELRGASYAETARRVIAPFVGDALAPNELAGLIEQTYASFDHAATAPLKQLGPDLWLLELFHGPTLAFKDFALQLLTRLFEHFLGRSGRAITIVGATSGDTGSAAIAACAGRANMRICILHPHGRVSPVQRRQMTTGAADNVLNLAVEGDFDDCQAVVKAMLGDSVLARELGLAAINSINWARIMAQAAYYVYAALRLGGSERAPIFVVPTGNFGNVYAGWVAAQMGLPVGGLVTATNRNDIVTRFFATGAYAREGVTPTLSPSMDIQVASNFERLLFELFERDGRRTAELMAAFARDGRIEVDSNRLGRTRSLFAAERVDEDATLDEIARTARETGEVVCPHTAVGLAAARRLNGAGPVVTMATAHPAKFEDAVTRALGRVPAAPPALARLADLPERFEVLPNDPDRLAARIRDFALA